MNMVARGRHVSYRVILSVQVETMASLRVAKLEEKEGNKEGNMRTNYKEKKV
jgi:hypothetical protein